MCYMGVFVVDCLYVYVCILEQYKYILLHRASQIEVNTARNEEKQKLSNTPI